MSENHNKVLGSDEELKVFTSWKVRIKRGEKGVRRGGGDEEEATGVEERQEWRSSRSGVHVLRGSREPNYTLSTAGQPELNIIFSSPYLCSG